MKKKRHCHFSYKLGTYCIYTKWGRGGERFKNTLQHCVVMKTSSLSVHKVDFVQYVGGNKASASFFLTFTNVSGWATESEGKGLPEDVEPF